MPGAYGVITAVFRIDQTERSNRRRITIGRAYMTRSCWIFPGLPANILMSVAAFERPFGAGLPPYPVFRAFKPRQLTIDCRTRIH